MRFLRHAFVPFVLLACSIAAQAQDAPARPPDPASQPPNWPGFRGYRANGVAEGFALPVEWDAPEKKGIAWSTEIPGLAHSSPVVWGEFVFVTSAMRTEGEDELSSLYGSPGYGAGESVEDEGEHAFLVYALDRKTGVIAWERTATTGVPKVKRHPKASHASSTPACDAEHVVAFFGSEGIYCYDHEGELQWKRDLGLLECGAPDVEDPSKYQWGFASSPVIERGRVYVQCDVQGQSFVACFAVKDGEELWRTPRDEQPTWCSPTVADTSAKSRPQLLLNGYRHIGGYDLETGAELWSLSGGGDVPVPTPVVANELVYLTSAHGREHPLRAIQLSAEGDVKEGEDSPIAWNDRRGGIYMQTPIVYGSELYACSDAGVLGCFDALNGEEIYRERVGTGSTGFSASPVAGDGKLYFTAESGEVFVVAAGRDFAVLATNDLGETCMATPAVSEGRLFFRARHHLIAVEAP